MQTSSGTTAIETTSDAEVTILPDGVFPIGRLAVIRLAIINEGAAAGFYRIGDGPWCRLPATSALTLEAAHIFSQAVQIKRVAGGANLTGVYAWGYSANR